jgi:hypothetical protein
MCTVVLHAALTTALVLPPPDISTAPDVIDPIRGLDAKDMELLQGLGFNAVRLGVLWQAVEPAQGMINTTYLARVKQVRGVCVVWAV